MIINKPARALNESSDHWFTKILVGSIADEYLTKLAAPVFGIAVAHEFQFKELWVEKDKEKPRFYTGDTVVMLFNLVKDDKKEFFEKLGKFFPPWIELQEEATHIMNFEIEGYRGHQSVIKKANDKLRDEELYNQCSILVHRMPFQTRPQRLRWTSDTMDEIIRFYYQCMSKWSEKNSLPPLQ
jgi:hypothetical protein